MSHETSSPTVDSIETTANPDHEGPIALFIYGLPGAGKSTVLSLADEYGIPSITMGEVVRERAKDELGEDFSSSELGQWATAQRKEHGPTIMAEYTREEIADLDASVVIVEGTRSPDEIAVFTNDFTVLTLRVDAPFTERLHRLQNRERDGEEEFTASDLHDRDARELVGWGLGGLYTIDTPNCVIENTGTLESYKETIREILQSITG